MKEQHLTRIRAYLGLLLVAFTLTGCASMYTTIRQHPDFATNQRAIHKVAVLPTKAEVELITFTGENERLSDKERVAADEVVHTAMGMLSGRGYTASSFQPADQADADELRFEVENIREALNKVSEQVYKTQSLPVAEAAQTKVTLGPMVNRVADVADADALLVINYYAFEKSSGQQAKDILAASVLGALTGVVAVPPASGSSVHLALVDGTTGDLLWSNVAGAGFQNPTAQCRTAMNDMPKVTGEAFAASDPLRQPKESEAETAKDKSVQEQVASESGI